MTPAGAAASATGLFGPGRLVLRGVWLPDGRLADVGVVDGRIDAIDIPNSVDNPAPDAELVDLPGYLLLPAPVEPHAHLDKAYSAEAAPNAAGDLGGAVVAWLRHRPSLTPVELETRARAAALAYLSHGATAIRTHVDIADEIGLRALTAIVAARGAVRGLCDIQVVAFVGDPVTGSAGERHRTLLRAAMACGADVVGGCPARDPDPRACIHVFLEVAGQFAAPVDLHIDEGLDPEPCTLALLSQAVSATGFPYRVVASHCVSLGMMPDDGARKIAEGVAEAGIAVICLPQTNLYLQGRDHPAAVPRGLTALRTLRAAGVTVAAGGDNLQDAFNCLGRADPLEAAALLVLAGHETPDVAYASVSRAARAALGLAPVEIEPGAPAELLAIRARSVREAIAESPADRVVVHRGRVVARTATTRNVYPQPVAQVRRSP
jgi:cytosine deaminase